MADYTASLGLEQITPGSQAGLWGNTTNNNLALIDQAVTGVTPLDFTGASGTTQTLTLIDGSVASTARSAVLNITGIATGSNTVIVPNKQKTYLVRNNTGQNVVFRTASPTATFTVEAGNSILIFCDGNNNVFTGIASPSVGTLGVSGGGTGATTFTAGFVKSTGGTNALTSATAVDLSSEVTGTLPVARGGTGGGSFTSGSLIVGNGTGALGTLTGGTVGQVATWNGSTWVAQTPSAASGVTSFNSRTGAVTLQSSDVTGALTYTPYNSTNPSGYISGSSPSITTPTITGITNGSVAGSGVVGQLITITSASPVNLTNNVITNVASGSIPAGDWDIFGVWTVKVGSGATLTFANGGLSVSPSTLTGTTGGPYSATGISDFAIAFPPQPLNIASATTYYINMFTLFSGGTVQGEATIYARRRR